MSVSNIFLLISATVTVVSFIYPQVLLFGINDIFLSRWLYHIYILQFFTWVFLHGSIMHLATNSLFIYIFWNQVEQILGTKKYIIFFVLTVVFIWIMLTLFSTGNTIGISGFAMAVLAYYTLLLREKKVEDYKWGITAMVINIWIWFLPGISLVWHLFWVIFWVVYFYITREYLRKSMIPVEEV